MSTMPAVIVKKGGFFSALFSGFFGFLIAVVVCSTVLGFYALHIVDSTAGSVLGLTVDVVSGLPQWQQYLPPMLAETLDDHRAPEYREQVDISVRTLPSPEDSSREVTVITVANNGAETITVLAMNVMLENEDGVPISERRVYAATPITIDEDDWRGPLLPAESRRFVVRHQGRRGHDHPAGLQATINVAELRLWNGPRPTPTEESAGEQVTAGN